MPIKKSSAKTTTGTATAAKKDHKHAELEASIAGLKLEIQSLKKQCDSCCAELEAIRAAAGQDSRLDSLLRNIKSSIRYENLRRIYK